VITITEVLNFGDYWHKLVVHAMHRQLVKQRNVRVTIGTISVLGVGSRLFVNGGLTLIAMFAEDVVTILF
jgi:hypothetical protein